MKKVFVIAGVLVVMAGFAVAMVINASDASTKAKNAPCETVTVAAETNHGAVPMSECETVKCGSCPGPNCKIDGICCYVPGGSRSEVGIADCGCTADGEPVCKCIKGVPR